MCLLAAFVPHRPNKYCHVTASNGIVSNSPYTPLAIMTASPIASVRVFDPRCRCRLATFAALPTPSMIEPIIMLTDHPLLAPHRQVRRCHRSIHCWHGHAARRSALPRERFSPMARSRHQVMSAARSLSGISGHVAGAPRMVERAQRMRAAIPACRRWNCRHFSARVHRKHKDLAGINAIWISNLVLVRFVNDCVSYARAVGVTADAPEAVATGYDRGRRPGQDQGGR